MVVKGTIRAVKPYGVLVQIQEVCDHIEGNLSHLSVEFKRIDELDVRVQIQLFMKPLQNYAFSSTTLGIMPRS